MVLTLLCIVTFVMGYLGYSLYYETHPDFIAKKEHQPTVLDIAYNAASLFVMQFYAEEGHIPPILDMARWLATFIFGYAAIKALFLIFNNSLKLLMISFYRGHIVVCGLNSVSLLIIESLKDSGLKTVVVDKDDALHNPLISKARQLGAEVIHENPNGLDWIQVSQLRHAQYLLAMTKEDDVNMEVIYQSHAMLKEIENQRFFHGQREPLKSLLYLEDLQVKESLYDHPIYDKDYDYFSAKIVNHLDRAARWLLNHHGPHHYCDINLKRTTPLKVFIIGDHKFIAPLLYRFALSGHFHQELKLTFIHSSHLNRIEASLKQRPELEDIHGIHILSTGARHFNTNKCDTYFKQHQPDLIYICPKNMNETLIWSDASRHHFPNVPMIICEFETRLNSQHLESMVNKSFDKDFTKKDRNPFIFVKPIQETFHIKSLFTEDDDRFAKALHQDYLKEEYKKDQDTRANQALTDWKDLKEHYKDSNRNQADHLFIKCKTLLGDQALKPVAIEAALTESETITHLAKMEHRRWMAEKRLAGWMYHEGAKNTRLKRNPSLKPWEELSQEEKNKDIAVVTNLPKNVRLYETTKDKGLQSI